MNSVSEFGSLSPAAFEPKTGWVDNLNGPTGLMIGVGKGVIRSVLVDENNRSEVIPVDYAINGLIVMPYEFNKSRKRPEDIPVYNVTNADHRKTKMGDVITMCKRLGREYPLNVGLWYPDSVITTNKLYHLFNVMMFHWLPAYFLDFLLLIFGQKRFMVRVQKKISTGLDVLQFFTLHPWYFKSDNFATLWQNLSTEDKAIFNMDMSNEHSEEEYLINCIKGGREYILKEKSEDLPKARFHQKIMYGIDRGCKTVIIGLFVYYLLKWTGVLALYSVTPSVQEPLPGWVDNLNGPTGVMIGAGKGVIRSMICNGELRSEIIPVDMAINGFILLPYRFSIMEKRPQNIPVFNLTVPEAKKRTWKWVMDVGRDLGIKYPFEIGLWYPDGNMTTNKLYHWFCVIMFMWLPAYFIDVLLAIFGQRRFMVRVQTRIAIGLEVLQFFTTRCWDFKSQNFEQIQEVLSPKDKIIFKIEMNDVDDYEYLRTCILGGRQYVMKEPLSSLPRARIQLKFLYFLDRFCKLVFLVGICYWLCSKVGMLEFLRATVMENVK